MSLCVRMCVCLRLSVYVCDCMCVSVCDSACYKGFLAHPPVFWLPQMPYTSFHAGKDACEHISCFGYMVRACVFGR